VVVVRTADMLTAALTKRGRGVVYGLVLENKDDAPLPGLRVQMYERDLGSGDLAGNR
jgi:hypothetical protein